MFSKDVEAKAKKQAGDYAEGIWHKVRTPLKWAGLGVLICLSGYFFFG